MWPAWHDVLKRLVVYESTYAKTATSQKGRVRVLDISKVKV